MLNLLIAITAAAPSFAQFADNWKTTLPAMIFGMLGIFIVIGVIIIATYGLNKLFSKKEHKKDE